MEGISKSQVSSLCSAIDDRVGAFLSRQLEGDWSYVWLDATYIKVRHDHRIVSIGAVGVKAVGRREVLGMTTGHSEAEPFWWGSCATWSCAACAASSWSFPMHMKG